MTRSTVLVTGSNGFVGKYMVRELVSRGFQVVCFVKNGTSEAVLHGLDVEIRRGDICDKDSVIRAVAGTQAVIHLAAAVGSPDPLTNYAVNVDGARHLVEACEVNGVARIISYSSISAMRERTGAYGRSKKEAESILLRSGRDVTILQTEMIYGNGSRGLHKIIAQIQAYPFFIPIVGTGEILRQPVYVRDIVGLTADIIDNPLSFRRSYSVAGKNRVTMREFVLMIAAELGVRKRIFPIPKHVALGVAHVFEKVFRIPPFTVDNMLGLVASTDVDITPAIRELGFKPTSIDVGLKRAVYELKRDIL